MESKREQDVGLEMLLAFRSSFDFKKLIIPLLRKQNFVAPLM